MLGENNPRYSDKPLINMHDKNGKAYTGAVPYLFSRGENHHLINYEYGKEEGIILLRD